MLKKIYFLLFMIAILILPSLSLSSHAATDQASVEQLILKDKTESVNIHPKMEVVKDKQLSISPEAIRSEPFNDKFVPLMSYPQEKGFFYTGNWLRFDVTNESEETDWILEFAFPLINQLDIYMLTTNGLERLYEVGSDKPFAERVIEHRFFAFPLTLEQNKQYTFYAYAVGSGDLHPPINLWSEKRYHEKNQQESIILGIFYGIILVMIIYNFFLFIGLRMRSYLFYVIMILFTLLGQLSINGIAFQYLWPNSPQWNLIAVPIFVSLACIFILLFSWFFLALKNYFPVFRYIGYGLFFFHCVTIITVFFYRLPALYFMVFFSILTFIVVLSVAIYSLTRGARQARFYIAGWLIFLTGVTITLLERSVVLPFNVVTEYAGQVALTIEVVLLSLALSDKIAIIRWEKARIQKEAKQAQELALQNLRKADALKDEFLAITSHELRTPLYGMIGIAESLQSGAAGEVNAPLQQQLDLIVTSGKRLTFLVDEILDLSKLKYNSLELTLQPIYLHDVLQLVLAIMDPLIKDKPITVHNLVPTTVRPVLADKNRLQQILYNLMDNAIKYTDKGTVTIDAFEANHMLTVRIADTGRGMSEQALDVIFKPFQQVGTSDSRQVGGIGIGLSITHELIELHHGTIAVDSIVGQGTTITFTLPTTERKAAVQTEQTTAIITDPTEPLEIETTIVNKSENDKTTILVADDETVNLQVLYNQLSLEGYHVLTVIKGEDVFTMLKKYPVDLLILDIMMPGMSGYEISKRLRTEYSLMTLPILMLTAKNQLQDKLIAFDAGANDYLVKPCEREELLTRVRTLVRVKKLNEEIALINEQLEDKVAERTYELKQAYDEVQAIAASKQQLLANISHELGTPVTTIHQYFQSIYQGIIKVDDPYYHQIVTDKINILDRLIDDLHQLSTLEAGESTFTLKNVPLANWLQSLNDKFDYIIQEQNRQFIPMDIPKHAEYFHCLIDKVRMDQLFSNLISNAIKHTKAGLGTITFRCVISANSMLAIEVIDNGQGIPVDVLPFIFERFYKKQHEDQELPSTGLGLPISKEIIRYHGGHLFVRKSDHQGTIFIIELPIEPN